MLLNNNINNNNNNNITTQQQHHNNNITTTTTARLMFKTVEIEPKSVSIKMLRNENSFSRRWFFVGVGIGYCLLIVIMRSGANTIKLYLAITNEALDFDIGIPSIHNLESTKLPPSTQCWFI